MLYQMKRRLPKHKLECIGKPLTTLVDKIHITKQSPMPYISMAISLALVARLTIFVRQRSATEFDHIDSLAIIQIGLIAIACIFLLSFPRQQEMWKRLSGTSGMMLVTYYMISGLSALWSQLPLYTAYRTIEYLSQILLVFVMLLYCSNFAEAERRALFVATLTALFGAGMVVKFYGFTLTWSHWHTNHYTTSAAIIFCYCFGEWISQNKRNRYLLWTYGCVALGLLLLGTSIASSFATGVGITIAMTLSKRGRSFLLPFLIIVVFVFGFMISMDATPTSSTWIELGQRLKILSPHDHTQPALALNGRMMLWTIYMQEIKDSPILGHGFAVSSRLASIYSPNTHNGFLAALLGTGAVGFTIIGWAAYRCACEIESCRRLDAPGTIGCAAALGAGVVNNMSISIVGENWRAPSLVFAMFLGLHLFFVLRRKAASNARPGSLAAPLGASMRRSPRRYHPARPCPIAMRRHAWLRKRA